MLLIFLKGLLIGFSIAAPVGPIGILCIRRTLAEGRASGFVSGLGAATADAFYGSVAGFGLAFISSFLISQGTWLRLLGGAFLIYLGVKTLLARPAVSSAGEPALLPTGGLFGAYASTFFLTLTNPLTILSFAAVFAGLGIGSRSSGEFLSAGLLVLGVFAGSGAWWFTLSSAASWMRTRLSGRGLLWINRISGLIILGFGLAALGSLLLK
jgi:threonine/homoserine/homoserine lactone efflux protein